tara:strand:- start:2076 stop:2507 length:432 start_codon:yes stop_codon:yes gene_type:complete
VRTSRPGSLAANSFGVIGSVISICSKFGIVVFWLQKKVARPGGRAFKNSEGIFVYYFLFDSVGCVSLLHLESGQSESFQFVRIVFRFEFLNQKSFQAFRPGWTAKNNANPKILPILSSVSDYRLERMVPCLEMSVKGFVELAS